jgi:hypothetical protein
VAKGLFIEAAATNLVKSSNELLVAQGYIESDILSRTTATSPSNGTAVGFYPTITNGYHRIGSDYLSWPAGPITVSCWFKRLNSNYRAGINAGIFGAAVIVDLNNAGSVVTLSGTASNKAATIDPYPNDWYRVTVTGTKAANGRFFLFMASSTSTDATGAAFDPVTGSQGMLMWGVQVEQGSSASSLIPTTTASLLRLADDAVIRSTAWTTL